MTRNVKNENRRFSKKRKKSETGIHSRILYLRSRLEFIFRFFVTNRTISAVSEGELKTMLNIKSEYWSVNDSLVLIIIAVKYVS